jgi:branched-subunit amino acid transport protein
MTVWIIMLGLAIGTFLLRSSFILILGEHEIHPLMERALRFVPAAVLSALVVPEILTRHDSLLVSPRNPQLIAGIIAGIIAWRSRSVVLTILGGMAALWALEVLLPGI